MNQFTMLSEVVVQSESTTQLLETPELSQETTVFEDMAKDSFYQLYHLMPDFWNAVLPLFGGHVWLLFVTIILLLTFVADFVFRVVIRQADCSFAKREKRFLETITVSLIAPVSFYIWTSGLIFALTTSIRSFDLFLDAIPFIEAFKSTLGLIAVAWFAIRWVKQIELYLKQLEREDKKWDNVTVEALAKIFRLTVFVITGLFVLSSLGVNLTGLIAFGGMGGIAVGFAAKDILGNVLGGLMLYMDKPFTTGDWIRSPDRVIEGTVESIGWRMTVVRTFDKRPLYIPNGVFSTISIENPSRMTHRRIKETIGVRYCDVKEVAKITSAIKRMLREHPDVASDQTLIVNMVTFSESSIDILVYTFTKTTVWVRYHEVKEDVMLKIAEVVEAHGAEMAFPTRTLYVDDSVKIESADKSIVREVEPKA